MVSWPLGVSWVLCGCGDHIPRNLEQPLGSGITRRPPIGSGGNGRTTATLNAEGIGGPFEPQTAALRHRRRGVGIRPMAASEEANGAAEGAYRLLGEYRCADRHRATGRCNYLSDSALGCAPSREDRVCSSLV